MSGSTQSLISQIRATFTFVPWFRLLSIRRVVVCVTSVRYNLGSLYSVPGIVKVLKPHVRHQRVYCMGTSGFMLIPVTPLTEYVAECAKCGFSGQANTAWGPSPKRSPIQYGRPSYIGAYVRTQMHVPEFEPCT